ncbi:MAG: Gfo/Idh/MocA family oxidoreductase, partial [Robiginitomaculum sp.]
MTQKLRAGIIGSGVFGGYHAGKYTASDLVTLTAIYDVNGAAADALAAKHGATGFDALGPFLDAVDIVTIASPAASHFSNASRALAAGKSVLIEKPISQTPGEAQILIKLARENGLTLAIGHQERLVFQAMGLYDLPERPTRIEASRMGAWNIRGSDVSVTMDLLIHDA